MAASATATPAGSAAAAEPEVGGVFGRLSELAWQALPAIGSATGFAGFVAVIGAAIEWICFDAVKPAGDAGGTRRASRGTRARRRALARRVRRRRRARGPARLSDRQQRQRDDRNGSRDCRRWRGRDADHAVLHRLGSLVDLHLARCVGVADWPCCGRPCGRGDAQHQKSRQTQARPRDGRQSAGTF